MITILTPFGKSNNGNYHVWLRHTVKFISSAGHYNFACVTNGDLLQLHQIVGHISFSNALSLLSRYIRYMLSMNTCFKTYNRNKVCP